MGDPKPTGKWKARICQGVNHNTCNRAVSRAVNGVDVSRASHGEAVKVFQEAQEPILVEVMKRPGSKSPAVPDLNQVTVGVQTDIAGLVDLSPDSLYLSTFEDLMIHDEQDPVPFIDGAPDRVYLDQEDGFPAPCYEYEEVILQRTCEDEKLGLTLYYSSPDEEGDGDAMDCYVTHLDPDGVASKDGRIRIGDQVLQVDGVPVESKQQVESLFAAAKSHVALLVIRPQFQVSLGPEAGLREEDDDEEGCQGTEGTQRTSLTSQPDSGLDHDSSRTLDESSEMESFEQNRTLLLGGKVPPSPSKSLGHTPDRNQKGDFFDSGTGTSCSSQSSGAGHGHPGHGHAKEKKDPRMDTLDRELYALDKKMESIAIECQDLVAKSSAVKPENSDHVYETIPEVSESEDPTYCVPFDAGGKKRSRHSGSTGSSKKSNSTTTTTIASPRLQARFRDVEEWVNETVSNNNSSQKKSGWKTPVRLELTSDGLRQSTLTLCPPMEDRCLQVNMDSDTLSILSCESCLRKCPPPRYRSDVSETMYTTRENVLQTMWMQQKMLRETMLQRQKTDSGSGRRIRILEEREEHREEGSKQWKVKIRPDGTRYITRRPVRNKLLRERASQIDKERSGLTTDDDATSEIKFGKYWRKEERKKHVEQAKERRRRQEAVIKAKMGQALNQGHGHPGLTCKRGNLNPADDFTTIQEILVHGNKGTSGGLLSVTTV
ncbi:unnamed protein product [Darwinula stevensoni]|uniref:PDZ domain-containing protein n=1 Tax=Darwinula stevensoni TaxID=69355 RepID=A0A7R8X8S4_9CRUS|nr:unnamed protein product [Darwinula stevensoni]CAG0890417.1 unnamed protein product [Darwinula stevensoni]